MRKLALLVFSIFLGITSFSLKIENDYIVDSKGNKIKNKKYERILILDPAAVESFYLIGGEQKIVAIADTAMNPIWPQEKTKKLPKAGTIMKPSIEQILMYNPDLVILNSMSEGFGENLKTRKLDFIVNEGKSLDEILNNIVIYGRIADKEEQAQEILEMYKSKLKKIKNDIEKKPLNKKGAFLFSTSPMMVFGPKSLPGQIFDILGIENIANRLPGGRPILSPEFLVSENPDILMGSMAIKNKDEIVKNNPIILQTKAGKNGKIMIVDSDKILRGTPRIIDALEELYEEISIEN